MTGPEVVFAALTAHAAREAQAYRRLLDHLQDCAACNGGDSCQDGQRVREALKEARQ